LARRAAAGGCAACNRAGRKFSAFVHIAKRPAGPIAVASFDERAAICEIFAYWKPPETASVIVVEAFDGLKLLESQQFQFISARRR
jgi:hypothetical protein